MEDNNKKLELSISCMEVMEIDGLFLRAKLEDAGFDFSKPITRSGDYVNNCIIFKQTISNNAMLMKVSPICSKCEKVYDDCSNEQVHTCLNRSVCEHCDGVRYGYPYGKDESRHCLSCGAEWSIWK